MLTDKLYKMDGSGKIRFWQTEIKGDKYRTVSGLVDGNGVISEWTSCKGTNLGRSNARSPDEQAKFEVESLYRRKMEREQYSEEVPTERKREPMRAQTYAGREDYISTVLESGVLSQPKLNGLRCLATDSGMISRKHEFFVTFEQIKQEIKAFHKQYSELILDGEIYKHGMSLQKISGVGRIKNTKDMSEDQKRVEAILALNIYDVTGGEMSDLPQKERLAFLANCEALQGLQRVQLVDTHEVYSSTHLDLLFEDYLLNGYEGQILRNPAALYEFKRSKHLLKRKPRASQEFILLDVEEGKGNWQGYAKIATLATLTGKHFKAGIRGNQAYCLNLLQNKQDYIGTNCTVEFESLSDGGLPVQAVLVELDRTDI